MRRDLMAVGVVLLVAGSLLCLVFYDVETTGQSAILSAFRGPMVTAPVQAAIERGERQIYTLTWFTWKPPRVMSMAAAEAQVLAMAKEVEIQYGATTRFTIPTFGVVAQIIPMENVGLVAAMPTVAGLDYDRVIRANRADLSEVYLSIGQVEEVMGFEELYAKGWTGQDIDIYYLDSGRALGVASAQCAIEGDTTEDTLELALHADPDPEIINVSLGASPTLFDSLNMGFEIAVRDFGVVVVAAAGNSPSYEASPARSPLVVSVGAVGSDLKLTDYSARNFDVVSVGDQRVLWMGSEQPARGTSFSSPVVSDLLACYMSGTGISPEEFDEIATLLTGSEPTLDNYPMPTGTKLAATDPIPETPILIKILPYLLLLMAGAVITFVAVSWQKLSVSRLIPKVT